MPDVTSEAGTDFYWNFNTSATMGRHRGQVQHQQSDLRLALKMMKMAKQGFWGTATEVSQHLIKTPHSEVRKEKKCGVLFPGPITVKAAIERHQ